MAPITSDYASYKTVITTAVLLVILFVSLVLNILLIFVFTRSKIFRRPPNLLLVNIAIADIWGALLWTIIAIIAASQWKWILGEGMCQFHGFSAQLSLTLNMYTFTAIAFEKFLKIFAPGKHADAFLNYKITLAVLLGVWVMSLVMSLMPMFGWGKFTYFNYILQCIPDYVANPSLLNFYFTVVVIIPALATLILFVACFIKIALVRKRAGPDGKVVLQERSSAPQESFAEKVRKQEDKFKFTGLKLKDTTEQKQKNKRKNKKTIDDDGYLSDSQSEDSMDEIGGDDLYFTDYEGFRVYERERNERRKTKRIFTFKRRYLSITIVTFIAWLIYVGLWLPYFCVTYAWVYDSSTGTEKTFTIFVLVSFAGITYKPLVYLINTWIRRGVKQAFERRTKKKTLANSTREETADEAVYNVREEHYTETYEETTTTVRSYDNRALTPE